MTPCCTGKNTRWLIHADIAIEIGMDHYLRPITIVETGSTQSTVFHNEAQGCDQMQSGTCIDAKAHNIPGIGWNLGLVKNNIEHWYRVSELQASYLEEA